MTDEVDAPPAARDYVGVLRRRAGYILTIIPAAILLATYLAFAIRPQYQATATILLESSGVVQKDVVETTVASHSEQQIEIVQGRVMSPDIMLELVSGFDPYPDETSLSPQKKAQRVVEDTSLERVDPVTLKPQAESTAFSLHYNNPNAGRSVVIANRLAQLFLTYNQRTRAEAAREAAGFLEKQSAAVSLQMKQIDNELARLKSIHGDALPELAQRNQAAVERTQRDLDGLQQQILTVEEKESLLSVELSQMSPNLIAQTGDLTDVATVRARLAEAEQRYTPDHPEVKRLRSALQTLMSQTGARRNGIATSANNPQYLMTASQLESVRRQLANLRAQADKTRGQMNEYEQLLRRTPLVESEYSEILRRRQSLQTEYQQINDKLQNAKMAQIFETEQHGERFTLLRGPATPKLPVYPNRIGLILLGLVLGLGLAGAAVAIVESADTNIRNARDLPIRDDAILLASIPIISNSHDRRHRRMVLGAYLAAYGTALIVIGATIVSSLNR
jgi:polysaccharide biosynthesis transport protein